MVSPQVGRQAYDVAAVNILLTNDDGITSRGLFQAKQALEPFGDVYVIAPDSNRSGSARGITIHRSLNVAEVELRDGTTGYATDGTPVDCVRFAHLGLVGERPDLIVSGINYGYNLGDDVTYSGTVAAAFEGILLGIPGIAISQGAPTASGSDFRRHDLYDFAASGAFLARLVEQVGGARHPGRHDPERQRPGRARRRGRLPAGQADLPRPAGAGGRRGGPAPLPHLRRRPVVPRRARAPTSGRSPRAASSVTPIHLDLTSDEAIEAMEGWSLS